MMYVPANHAIESTLAAVDSEIALELEYEIHGLLDPALEVAAETPISKSQAVS